MASVFITPRDPSNMNYIIFFKTASLRDKLINLDPGVKHLDDTRVESSPSVNKKIKHHTQFPSMEGCRAAAGWSEKPRKYCHPAPRYAATHSLVIASHRRWRGNLFCIVVFHNVSLGRLCALCVSSYLFKLR